MGAARQQPRGQSPVLQNTTVRPVTDQCTQFAQSAARFQPGSIGLTANWANGRVSSVAQGGQAEREGVEVGMIFAAIEGRPFSVPLLDQHIAGQNEYTVTFNVTRSNELGGIAAQQGEFQMSEMEVRREERQTKAAMCCQQQ